MNVICSIRIFSREKTPDLYLMTSVVIQFWISFYYFLCFFFVFHSFFHLQNSKMTYYL